MTSTAERAASRQGLQEHHGTGIIAPRVPLIDPQLWDGLPVPERRWIVPGWIPLGNVTLFSGDGGLGKSLIAMQLLTACATGGTWLGKEVMACKALGVFCEDEEHELHRRQTDINRQAGIEMYDLENLALLSRDGGEDNLLCTFERFTGVMEDTGFMDQLTNAALQFAAQLIVLDSLHDIFSGNENDRFQVRSFVRRLRRLAREIQGSVVVTAHPSVYGLNSGSGSSGSTGWNNAVRSRLYLTEATAEDGDEVDQDERVLTRKKANYAARSDQIKIRWREGQFEPVEDPTAGGFVGSLVAGNAETAFLALLERMTAEGRDVCHKPRAGNYAPRVFAKRPDRNGFGRRDFEQAMERLFATDRVEVERLGTASRPWERIKSTAKPNGELKDEEIPF